MYLSRAGEPFAAGHGGAGVAVPATRWFLAEGATGSFFELFLLLMNPTEQPAPCELRYLTSSGATFVKPYVLAPNSRTTSWVDQENIPGLGHVLADTAVSTLGRQHERTGDAAAVSVAFQPDVQRSAFSSAF